MASYEEYENYLRENLNALERIGDGLSGADERLDYAVKQLQAIQTGLAAIEVKPETVAAMQQLSGLLQELKEVGFVMPTLTQQIAFDFDLAPNQGVRLEDLIPLDGNIISVGFHWPRGCNALVDIAVGHGYKQFMPISGFLALNNASPVYPTQEKVKREETAWCIMNNYDGSEHHHVAATVTIAGD